MIKLSSDLRNVNSDQFRISQDEWRKSVNVSYAWYGLDLSRENHPSTQIRSLNKCHVVYKSLESLPRITQTERGPSEIEQSRGRCHCCLMYIRWLDRNLVIWPSEVDLREIFSSCKTLRKIMYVWYRISIRHRLGVQTSVVAAWSPVCMVSSLLGTIWSIDDHSLSLGSITPSFIISSNSRFAVTDLSGAGAQKLGDLLSQFYEWCRVSVSPFAVAQGTYQAIRCIRFEYNLFS